MSIRASRTNIVLRPDPSRVFFRPFDLMSQERITRIVARVTALERSEAEQEARIMLHRFVERHVKLEGFLLRRFEVVRDHVISDRPLNDWQKLLVGAYLHLNIRSRQRRFSTPRSYRIRINQDFRRARCDLC